MAIHTGNFSEQENFDQDIVCPPDYNDNTGCERSMPASNFSGEIGLYKGAYFPQNGQKTPLPAAAIFQQHRLVEHPFYCGQCENNPDLFGEVSREHRLESAPGQADRHRDQIDRQAGRQRHKPDAIHSFQVRWKISDRTISRFVNAMTGRMEFEYGLPTPASPNVRFTEEVQCEAGNAFQIYMPITYACCNRLIKPSYFKSHQFADSSPDNSGSADWNTMKNILGAKYLVKFQKMFFTHFSQQLLMYRT